MNANGDTYDVAVVGASVAGCTAARLFALRGTGCGGAAPAPQ